MSKKGFNMNEEEGQSFEDTGNSSTSSLPKVVKRVKTTTVKGKGKGKVKQEGATGESDFDVNGNGKKGVRKMRKTSSDRKKTSRACGSCQKAHLTCDDGSFASGFALRFISADGVTTASSTLRPLCETGNAR